MQKHPKEPLMRPTHLPLVLLGLAITAYGLVTAVVGSWLSSQAMSGLISPGAYRARLATFDQTAGLIAGLAFLVLFILCAMRARGIVRTAFGIGAVASVAPLLAGRAEGLLFGMLGLPTMSAGSVLAGAIVTLLFALPLAILFILLAFGRRVPRAIRWFALLAAVVVLVISFFPVYVTVLAFLLRPGDPAVGGLMETSTQIIRLRYLVPGVLFLILAALSARFSRRRLPVSEAFSAPAAVLLALSLALASCAAPTPATPTPTPRVTVPPAAAGGVYDGLNLTLPPRYDPPIELHSVKTVDATVKFLEGDDISNNVWTRAYRDLMGINITYDWVVDASMYEQKLGLSANSGAVPDVFVANAAQFRMFHEAGLLADLTDVYAAEASDNTRDILTQDPVALKAATIEGKLWGIPLTDASVTSASVLWVRQDWMDKLGIQPPTTMADVLEISRRFTEEDPDGDGAKDTIGLALHKELFGAIAGLQGFFNGYHAYPGVWFERDGKLVYGSVQPEMRDALLALQKMYAAGQIDREFGVKDINAINETIAQGECGMEFGVWWNPYHPLNLSQANDPNAYWQAFPIPSVDGTKARSQYGSATSAFLVVRAGYEHPEALVRMVNFWTDNIVRTQDDNVRRIFLGDINNPDVSLYKYTPVVLWEPNAAIEGGKKLREALAKRDPTGLNLDFQWRYRIIQAYFEQGTKEAWVEVATNGPNGSSVILQEVLQDRGILNRFYGPPTPVMAEKLPTLVTMEEEMITKVIMGDPIERFDQFAQQWQEMGGSQIVEEVNQWAAQNR